MDLNEILTIAFKAKGSDIHIKTGLAADRPDRWPAAPDSQCATSVARLCFRHCPVDDE